MLMKAMVLAGIILLSQPLFALEKAEQAIVAYQKGQFQEATSLYLQLAEAYPASASLYHNLGSTLYRQGDLGMAVAAYLRAARLEPRDPDIRFNLNFLLAKGQDKLEARLPPEPWQRLLVDSYFSEIELFYASLVFFCLGCLGAAWAIFRRRNLPLFLLSPLACLASLYLGANLYYKRTLGYHWGAIRSEVVSAYSSPTDKNAVVIFKLHAGAPCAIVEERGEWYKIKLSDLKTGWIPRQSLAVFGAASRPGIAPPTVDSGANPHPT